MSKISTEMLDLIKKVEEKRNSLYWKHEAVKENDDIIAVRTESNQKLAQEIEDLEFELITIITKLTAMV